MQFNVDLIVNVYNAAIGARPTSPLQAITKLLTTTTDSSESESLSSSESADCDCKPCNSQSHTAKCEMARARLVKSLFDYKQTAARADDKAVCHLCDQWTPSSTYAKTLFALAKTIKDVHSEHPEILAEVKRAVDLPNLFLAVEWYYGVVRSLRADKHVCLRSAKAYRGILLPFRFRASACDTIQASTMCLRSMFGGGESNSTQFGDRRKTKTKQGNGTERLVVSAKRQC